MSAKIFDPAFLLPFITTKRMALAAVAVSAFSLAAAYVAQYGFDLQPCILCLYQRVPFAAVIVLGMAAYFVPEKQRRWLIALCGVAFAAGAAIAAFHTGVERLWWKGTESCTSMEFDATSVEAIMEQIKNNKFARCDQIPWALFGLSMANYNALMSAALSAAMFIGLKVARKDP